MKMKRYIIAVLIVFVCIDIALGAWMLHSRSAFSSMPETARVDALKNVDLSPIDCGYLMPKNSRDMCFHELAKRRTDASFCGDISDQGQRNLCYFEIYSVTRQLMPQTIEAAAIGDINLSSYLCHRMIFPEQEICDGYIALVTDPGAENVSAFLRDIPEISVDDPEAICSSILNSSYRDSCFTSIRKCDKVENATMKDSCFLSLSKANSSLCVRIMSPSVRDNCYEWFVQNGDYSVCDGFSDTALKEQCGIMREAYSDYGIEVNYLPYGNETEAMEMIAADSPDLAERICDKVLKNDVCYYALSVGTGDPESCQGIGSQPGIDMCLIRMAERMNDSDVCGMVSAERQEICVADVTG